MWLKDRRMDIETKYYFDTMSFNLGIAMELDINCALVYQHISFWVDVNEKNKANFKDGKYWTFQPVKKMVEYVKCLNERQINYALEKLEESGRIISKTICWSGNTWDRTKSYTINTDLEIVVKTVTKKDNTNLQNCKMEDTKLVNDNLQNCKMNYKDSKKDIKKDSKEKTNKNKLNDEIDLTNQTNLGSLSKDQITSPSGIETAYQFYKVINDKYGTKVNHSILDDTKLFSIMQKLSVDPDKKNKALFETCLEVAEMYNSIKQAYPTFSSDFIDPFEKVQLAQTNFNLVHLYNKANIIKAVYEKLQNKRLLNKDNVKVQADVSECVETQNIRFKGLSKKQIEVITKYEKDNNEIVEESDFYLILKHFGG